MKNYRFFFLTGRFLDVKLFKYSFDVRSYLQKKFHGDLLSDVF